MVLVGMLCRQVAPSAAGEADLVRPEAGSILALDIERYLWPYLVD